VGDKELEIRKLISIGSKNIHLTGVVDYRLVAKGKTKRGEELNEYQTTGNHLPLRYEGTEAKAHI